MKGVFLGTILSLFMMEGSAQKKYYTKAGTITFFSKSLIEDIEAGNKSVSCVVDASTGFVQFALKMRGFKFRKSLMQEHFNENYAESDKFPQASFTGKIVNNDQIDYLKDGDYPARVTGDLQMHGLTNPIDTDGMVTVKAGIIEMKAQFKILLSEYKIDIPSLVKSNINNSIAVKVDCALEPLK